MATLQNDNREQQSPPDPGAQPPAPALTAFHVLFILTAAVVALVVGVWAVFTGRALWGLIAVLAALGLYGYERWFQHEARLHHLP